MPYTSGPGYESWPTTGAAIDAPVTMALAEQASRYRFDLLPRKGRRIAVQCLIDWFAVTLAAKGHPVQLQLMNALSGNVDAQGATIVGYRERHAPGTAALVNGTTAHALDYDDVNITVSGHPSAVVLAALLAVAETRNSSGLDIMSAFVAGYETACRVGALLNPDHMQRGFHTTATLCSFGSAAACSHLLGFDAERIAHAMGFAGTSASGLKAMFGTAAKSLHAGYAARTGLEAALLVEAGSRSRIDILECPLGFAATHSSDFNAEKMLTRPMDDLYLYENLFKYDASCFGTHASIACSRALTSKERFDSDDIASISIRVDTSIDTTCNIRSPQTGIQGQFSVLLNVAFALAGLNTSDPASYSDSNVKSPRVKALMDKMAVELVAGWPPMQAEVIIVLNDGRVLSHLHDAAVPQTDLDEQFARVVEKFTSLAPSVLGGDSSAQLLDMLLAFPEASTLADVMDLCAPN